MADRYTVLDKAFDELPVTLEQANALGLTYFVTNGNGRKAVRVYLFFDIDGMRNYLSGIYDHILDDVRSVLNGPIEPEEKLRLISGMIGSDD